MSIDILEGRWKQIRVSSKVWWSKLSEGVLDRVPDKRAQLVGVLHEKYGYSRAKAGEEIDRSLREYN